MKRAVVVASAAIVGFAALGVAAFVLTRGRSYQPPAMVFEGDSENLRQSVIVPTLDTRMPKGKNVIWCGTIQLAWNRLEKDVLHEPPQIQGAAAVASRLNQAQLREDDLPLGSYLATAGFAKDGVVDKVRSEMKRRFQKEVAIDGLPGTIEVPAG